MRKIILALFIPILWYAQPSEPCVSGTMKMVDNQLYGCVDSIWARLAEYDMLTTDTPKYERYSSWEIGITRVIEDRMFASFNGPDKRNGTIQLLNNTNYRDYVELKDIDVLYEKGKVIYDKNYNHFYLASTRYDRPYWVQIDNPIYKASGYYTFSEKQTCNVSWPFEEIVIKEPKVYAPTKEYYGEATSEESKEDAERIAKNRAKSEFYKDFQQWNRAQEPYCKAGKRWDKAILTYAASFWCGEIESSNLTYKRKNIGAGVYAGPEIEDSQVHQFITAKIKEKYSNCDIISDVYFDGYEGTGLAGSRNPPAMWNWSYVIVER